MQTYTREYMQKLKEIGLESAIQNLEKTDIPRSGLAIPITLNGSLIRTKDATSIDGLVAVTTKNRSIINFFDLRCVTSKRTNLESFAGGGKSGLVNTDRINQYYDWVLEMFSNQPFCRALNLTINKEEFMSFCREHLISPVIARRNFTMNLIDFRTADYYIAIKFPEDFCRLCGNDRMNPKVLRAVLRSRLLRSDTLYSEYYVNNVRSKPAYYQARVVKDLKDFLPIAIKVKGAQNALFERLFQLKETRDYSRVFVENFEVDELKELVYNSQVVQSPLLAKTASSDEVQIMYVRKCDMLKLSGILFQSYTLRAGAHILNSMTDELYHIQYPFKSSKWWIMMSKILEESKSICTVRDENLLTYFK